MSLFGGLQVGRIGLQTSSNALNTVAHNLSNTDTEGYTRQQVSLSTRHYNIAKYATATTSSQEIGMGVRYAETRQVRDYFLDKTYRLENGRSAFYGVSYDALLYTEDILGESGGNSFQDAITDYWKTIQELASDPSSSVTQGLFVSKAQTLIERAADVYNSISDYQDNLNTQIKSMVTTINECATRIAELNNRIVAIEVAGVENANDLKDERNSLLDTLSGLAKITYETDIDGYVGVKIEGVDLVKRDNCFTIGLDQDENGFYTPYWTQNASKKRNEAGETVLDISAAKVFDMERTISSDLNTDIGKLKATLLARGDHRANSDDLEDADHYNTNIAESVCMNIQAEFDRLVSSVVTTVNKILSDAGYTDGTGNTDDCLFVRIVEEEGWHANNITVNPKYLQQPTLVCMKTPDSQADYSTAEKLKDAFNAEEYVLNPNTGKKSSFLSFYSDLVTQVGNTGSVYKEIYQSQELTVEAALNAREQIVGVSTDEELEFMIMYQNAYNASSRYITTLNDMLANLIAAYGG